MAKKSYPEKIDDFIFDSVLRVRGRILETYPEDALIDSMMRSTYVAMSPQEKANIIQNLGPDWLVKISAEIEKKLTRIDKQGER
jgi:hypothetical protein|tara:strand:+ start:1958 stop:2209 length:252 start_codon:yes stop_codon:yes gene_type:complete